MSILWSTVISVALSVYLVAWSGCLVSGTSTTESTSPSDAACQADGSDTFEEEMETSSDKKGALMVKPNLDIEIDGHMYRLDKVPPENSKVVFANKKRLLGDMDLEVLIDDFGSLGDFIKLAYNGAVAAGAKFIEIQIEIQDIGYSITNLFDVTALTVSRFKAASESVLIDLQSTYDFLVNNLEEIAFETLSSILDVAKNMEKAAQQLQEEAKKEQSKLIRLVKKTQRARGEEEVNIERKAKERELFEQKRNIQEKRLQEALQEQREAEDKLSEFQKKEEEAIKSMDDAQLGFFEKLANVATSIVGVKAFDEEENIQAAKRKASHWKEMREQAEKAVREYKEERHIAEEQMIEFAMKIKNCEGDKNMAKAAEEALHKAIGALKHIATVMQSVIQFWKQVKQHCEFLANDKLIENVQFAIEKYSDEQRLKVWTSRGFKTKAIHFYAGWVAVRKVCNDIVEHIKLTREDLYEMLEANPTYEESRKNVKDLATRFLNRIQKKTD